MVLLSAFTAVGVIRYNIVCVNRYLNKKENTQYGYGDVTDCLVIGTILVYIKQPCHDSEKKQ